MEEWRCKSAPLEQLLSEQGTKWEDDDDLESSDLETLRKYKLTTQVCEGKGREGKGREPLYIDINEKME